MGTSIAVKSRPRHSSLKRKAEIIDTIIDEYNKVRQRKNFPRKIVEQLVDLFFPDSNFVGRGVFKEVHAVRSRARKRVLKLSSAKSTTRDWKAYNKLPGTIRNRYFAKIYWRTKYCQLQKYGTRATVPEGALKKLRQIGKKYDLADIKSDNVRKVEGSFKIVDASG